MAWAYGNKKWQLTFRSLKGVECVVSVYKRGYTGSSVTDLVGQESPFTWEEDTSDNLLNVVRTKTGYLNVVETQYGALVDMNPATDIDHFVEFTYGGTLYFTGFMQAQNFQNDWVASPRKLSFPVQSPLAVAQGLTLSVPNEPAFVSIASVLQQVCNGLQANITKIIFPTEISVLTRKFDLSWIINTLAYCPFNSDYSIYTTSEEPLFSPEQYNYFLEGICNMLGLMVHDMPGYLVFTRFDYKGRYYSFNVGSTSGSSYTNGSTLIDLSSSQILSDKGKESVVRPIYRLDFGYDGDVVDSMSINVDHSKVVTHGSYMSTDEEHKMSYYVILNPSGNEFQSNYLKTNGYPMVTGANGVWLGAFGGDSLTEGIAIHPATSWSESTKVLRYRYYDLPRSNSFSVNVSMKRGYTLEGLENGYIRIGIIIKNGSYYYNQDENEWQTSEFINYITSEDGELLSVPVSYWCQDAGSPLDITITNGDMVSTLLYVIDDITVEVGSSPDNDYIYDKGASTPAIKSNNGSVEKATIDAVFNVAVKTSNMVVPSGAQASQQGAVPCQYPYLFVSQNRLEVDFYNSSLFSPSIYANLVKFFIDSYRWRIIGISFDAFDDKATVVMHRSPTLE